MIVVDLNLLVYAANRDAREHTVAHAWWRAVLADGESVGLAWSVVLGFVRLTTSPRIMPRPLAPEDAFAAVDAWLAQPSVRTIEPTDRHWGLVKELLGRTGTAANLTSDAHLAALAIEHGARLHSTDNDFDRFRTHGLRWVNPLAA
jgi:hypothetical protein